MVDQPLGQRRRQHQLALGDSNEAVAQPVEPELGAAGLADAGIEMMRVLDMAGGAGGGGEHPIADMIRVVAGLGQAAFENGRELLGDRKLQGHAGFRVLDPERERVHVDPLPAQGQHLFPAHAGVEPEQYRIPDGGVVDLRFDAGAPARQHFRRAGDLAPRLAVELAAAGDPEIDRIAQSVPIDAGPAIDRPQERYRPVGGRPTVVRCDGVEAQLDVPAGDGIEGPGQPVAEISVGLVAVELVGPFRTIGIDRHVFFEGISQSGHGAGHGALVGGIGAAGHLAEEVLCQLPRLLDGDPAVAADRDPLDGGLSAAVAGAVVDDEGLGAPGVDADAETGQLVVPGDPGRVGRLERIDGPLGECRAHLRDAFSRFLWHGATIGSPENVVNTQVNTRKEITDAS